MNDEKRETKKATLLLTGLAGVLRNESIEIAVGETVVVGRSRSWGASPVRAARVSVGVPSGNFCHNDWILAFVASKAGTVVRQYRHASS